MQKTALIILDGWGIAPKSSSNAISQAHTPFMDYLLAEYPNSQLLTSGEEVGLPQGQMGNSEVGHLNLGAGRIVWQELANINKAVRERTLDQQPILLEAFKNAKENNVALHLMGLVSDGGVHSHINHLKHLCTLAKEHELKQVYIHAFTDGRDTDPKGGINYLSELQSHLDTTTGKIASITGRYYAMDRDKRWERIKIAYDALVLGKGNPQIDWKDGILASYEENITDEFIQPIIIIDSNNEAIGTIKKNDVVVCFNFRTDRCREITQVLTQMDLPELGMKKIPLHYVTMTRYDDSYQNIHVIYEKDNLTKTLGEILETNQRTQLRIAETEKYPHVTFFFNGGREDAFQGEQRIMVPSPKVATYDLQPEMSAHQVTQEVIKVIQQNKTDFICLNYANADMVGHTGSFKAAIKAVETVDSCLSEVVKIGLEKDYIFIIIADHGNADKMINTDGTPNTAHTTNPVPCILVSGNKNYKINNGRLADIAPTLLNLMGITSPVEMTGKILTTS